MPRRRCYPSDTWDDEWALIEPLLPVPAWETPADGRPESTRWDCQTSGVTGVVVEATGGPPPGGRRR